MFAPLEDSGDGGAGIIAACNVRLVRHAFERRVERRKSPAPCQDAGDFPHESLFAALAAKNSRANGRHADQKRHAAGFRNGGVGREGHVAVGNARVDLKKAAREDVYPLHGDFVVTGNGGIGLLIQGDRAAKAGERNDRVGRDGIGKGDAIHEKVGEDDRTYGAARIGMGKRCHAVE